MLFDDDESRTELPTAKKLSEAWDKGNFAKAPEIALVAILAGTFIVLLFKAKEKATLLAFHTIDIFNNLNSMALSMEGVVKVFQDNMLFIGSALAPLFFSCVGFVVVAIGLQTGFHVSTKVLEVDWNRFNPVNGIQRLFNFKNNLVAIGIDLLKFIAVGIVIYGALMKIRFHPIFYTPVPIQYIGGFIFDIFMMLLMKLIFIMAVIATLNYLYQKYAYTKNLMMTKQEVTDESRQAEGDPAVKGEQKKRGMKLLRSIMIAKIKKADVIITNPTHYAVALKYEKGHDMAPILLAKGEQFLALRIKEEAKKHGVPIVENPPAARLLYRIGKVGEPIPADLYQVVADILVYVYRTHRYYFYRLKLQREQERAKIKHAKRQRH